MNKRRVSSMVNNEFVLKNNFWSCLLATDKTMARDKAIEEELGLDFHLFDELCVYFFKIY